MFNVGVRFFWVPSHDKKSENFVVPAHYSEDEMRHANKVADTAATAALEQAINASGIEAWLEEYKGKVEWANKALILAHAAGRQYEKWSLSLCSAESHPIPPPTNVDQEQEEWQDVRLPLTPKLLSEPPSPLGDGGANCSSTRAETTDTFIYQDECILSQTYG